MTPLPQSPFVTEPIPFVLDVDRFLADLGVDPLPVFLSNPSQEFLSATELIPIVDVLTKY